MTIDFFVHPEHGHHSYGAYHDQNVYGEFINHLTKVALTSEFPILIKGMHQKTFFSEIIPINRQVFSAAKVIQDRPHDLGEVHPEEWGKFVDIIKGKTNEEMRIHGCNFGECTRSFGVQLFGFLKDGKHWRQLNDANEYEREDTQMMLYQKRGDFRASKVRYGITLAPSFPNVNGVKIIPPKKNHKIPNGNIDYQLTDEKSKLYGQLIFNKL